MTKVIKKCEVLPFEGSARKSGNSIIVGIPKSICKLANIERGMKVKLGIILEEIKNGD